MPAEDWHFESMASPLYSLTKLRQVIGDRGYNCLFSGNFLAFSLGSRQPEKKLVKKNEPVIALRR
jgi:hypothetical protein